MCHPTDIPCQPSPLLVCNSDWYIYISHLKHPIEYATHQTCHLPNRSSRATWPLWPMSGCTLAICFSFDIQDWWKSFSQCNFFGNETIVLEKFAVFFFFFFFFKGSFWYLLWGLGPIHTGRDARANSNVFLLMLLACSTPPFTSTGPICLRRVARRVPRPVWIGP